MARQAGRLRPAYIREHTEPCDVCRERHREYQREYRTRPGKRERTNQLNRIRSRALWTLAAAHPEEYRALVWRYTVEEDGEVVEDGDDHY